MRIGPPTLPILLTMFVSGRYPCHPLPPHLTLYATVFLEMLVSVSVQMMSLLLSPEKRSS